MKSKKIKNTLLVVLTLAIVAAASVAITYAYVEADLGSKENTFTNDEITVEISEQKWDGTPGTGETDLDIPNNELGQTMANSYSPSMMIPKNPMITNISDTSAGAGDDPKVWVAIKATYTATFKNNGVETKYSYSGTQFETAIAKLYTGSDKDTATTGMGFGSGWTANSNETVFYYNTAIDNKGSTNRLFDFVKINDPVIETWSTNAGKYVFKTYDSLTTAEHSTIYADELPEFHINLKGYAVQYDGTNVKTAADAKPLLDALIAADS